MSQDKYDKIARDNSAWIDPGFEGTLDMRGVGIGVTPLPTKDESFVDTKFGQVLAQESQGIRNSLVRFINDNPGDKELRGELKDISQESELVSVSGFPCTVTYAGGDWTVECAVEYDNGDQETLAWVGSDRTDVLLDVASYLKQMLSPRAVEPSEAAKLKVARLCGSGQTSEGLISYLEACFPGLKSAADGERIWNDPQNVPIFNAACTFCWRHSNSSVSPSAEFLNHYLPAFANGRPYTVTLIEAAHQSYTRELSLGRVVDALPKEPTASDLDNLSDEEIESLKSASLREHHRQTRGAR